MGLFYKTENVLGIMKYEWTNYNVLIYGPTEPQLR